MSFKPINQSIWGLVPSVGPLLLQYLKIIAMQLQ